MNGKLIRSMAIIIICSLFFITLTCDVLAQARRSGTTSARSSSRKGVTVRKLEVTKSKSPNFSSSINETTTTPGDWTKVLVRFDTEADWTDQVEMKFFIVVKNAKSSALTMFTGSYVYSDIPKGRGHQVAVFLRPRTTERYGVAKQAGVEVSYKGEVVSAGSYPESTKPWWRTATVRSVEGYVLDRSQTPFAIIAGDNYERPKGK